MTVTPLSKITKANATPTSNNEPEPKPNHNNDTYNFFDGIMDQENANLFQFGLIVVGAAAITKVFFIAIFYAFYALAFPIAILFAMQSCPPNDTFDTKKELKRVLRGVHLPEEHPNKPKKDWFSRTISRAQASIGTELATTFGYEVSFTNIFGVFSFATVHVSVVNTTFYWIGVHSKWRYLTQREGSVKEGRQSISGTYQHSNE